MTRHVFVPAMAIVGGLLCADVGHAQARLPGARYDGDVKGEKPGPAPRRDLSGIWEPASGAGGGIQGKGAQAMDSCRKDPKTGRYTVQENPPLTDTGYATVDRLKPEIEPPYTPLGLQTLRAHEPVEGYRMVPDAVNDDPILACDPGGFPRVLLHDFRTSEIEQTPTHMVMLASFKKDGGRSGRTGVSCPGIPGCSVDDRGRSSARAAVVGLLGWPWVDDFTFVARTNGFHDDRTWLDNAGLPQSDAMEVGRKPTAVWTPPTWSCRSRLPTRRCTRDPGSPSTSCP